MVGKILNAEGIVDQSNSKPTSTSPFGGSELAKVLNAMTNTKGSPITFGHLTNWFNKNGFCVDDPIFKNLFSHFDKNPESVVDLEELESAFHLHCDLFERMVQGRLAIPNFKAFREQFSEIFEEAAANKEGSVADYIPQLAKVNPELFAASFCSVDGQKFSLGDVKEEFCVQSCSKPITYSMVAEEHGLEIVHRHVGREPSGRGFNDFVFDYRGLPHNPMINSGAIMCASLIRPENDIASRFEVVLDTWRELSGYRRIGYDNTTYLSEKSTADRNYALGHFMRENKAFPEGTKLNDVIDLYIQICSISLDSEAMSVVAGTLANGGVCPLTGHRIFCPETVRGCLALMYSCGLYDYSGEFAFKMGMPAKSGVSGAMMVIVPNVMGICIWSPRLDRLGNSVRGLELCRLIQERFHFHIFDQLVPGLNRLQRQNDKKGKSLSVMTEVSDLCYAAADGDLSYVKMLIAKGADPTMGDYDGRTPLHLAASEGHLEVVKYLIEHGAKVDAIDRFGFTPIKEAKKCSSKAVLEYFLGQK